MQPDSRFDQSGKRFWANVRIISQVLGYTEQGQQRIKTYSLAEMKHALERVGLHSAHLEMDEKLTELGQKLVTYFEYRAELLNTLVEPLLMDREEAANLYQSLKSQYHSTLPEPMNKQKGEKRTPQYFTAMINMIIEANRDGLDCNYDPRTLTMVTKNNAPLRTLARRLDGCFPSHINPTAVWEIKEYYNTTTFGSRVADGVYESLLDGLELEELREHEQIEIQHLLMIDSHYTWWECGRSYLCRIIDMLNMGYVDEVLFGKEIVERLPRIVQGWVAIERAKQQNRISPSS